MAIASGAAVANLYYVQPLLAEIAQTFHASTHALGILSMLTQVGYACGLLFFVPLGDRFEQRRLIVILLILVSILLAAMATSVSMLWLWIFAFLVGLTTVVPQIIIPLAANMADETNRGKVVGVVMSGLLIGVLLARAFAGLLGSELGWRSVFGIAAIFMIALALLLYFMLPVSPPKSKLQARDIFLSLWQLIRTLPTLREAALMGGLLFAAFSAFWTTLVFRLSTSPYHYGAEVAGFFGLLGVAGASIAPVAGRLADLMPARRVAFLGALCTLLSFLVFAGLSAHLWGLILGVILLDLGVQAAQISNQARIYSLRPDARNRLNTVYMTSYFIGGALGSAIGADMYAHFHWLGVASVGFVCSFAAALAAARPVKRMVSQK
ncbi:MFS transporter [Alicyclobacillus sp. TC]|nr:MFS transporter [Alicyclobacillus sp. TC]